MASQEPTGDYERVYLSERRSWRRWLEKNHAIQRGIWLVFYKKATRKPSLEYEESVEEALCFGWVDSRTRRLDDERVHVDVHSPQAEQSLVPPQQGEAGGERADDPSGFGQDRGGAEKRRLDGLRGFADLVIPDDLAAALAEGTSAQETFGGFSISVRKNILWWIASARRPETRARRIAKTAAAVAENRNPL